MPDVETGPPLVVPEEVDMAGTHRALRNFNIFGIPMPGVYLLRER